MDIRTMLLVLLASTIIIKIMKYYWDHRKFYILSWKLPGPMGLPVIGNSLEFISKNEDLFSRLNQIFYQYPSPMRIWLGPKMFLILRNAHHIEKILKSSNFNDKEEKAYRFLRDFVGTGLITESGPKWKNDRKILDSLLTTQFVKTLVPNFLIHSNMLIQSLNAKVDEPTFNVKDNVQRSVCDLINETLFGVMTDAYSGRMDDYLESIRKCYILVHSRILKIWLQIDCIFKMSDQYKEQEEMRKKIHGFLRDIYHERRNLYEINQEQLNEESLLSKMIRYQNEVQEFANEDDFIYHLTSFYLAGEDTLTTITSMSLVLFGLFPDIQEKAYREISSIVSKDREISEEDVSRMKYLERCLKDILRLFPIAPFMIRTTRQPYVLDSLEIPQGCSVILAVHNVHRDSRYWKTPDTFNPDHFLPEEIAKRPKFSYLPFSAGARVCYGKIYAKLGLKIILASILQNFVIEAQGKFDDYKLTADISVRFVGGKYPVRITKRL